LVLTGILAYERREPLDEAAVVAAADERLNFLVELVR
jgi:hypothetical protein